MAAKNRCSSRDAAFTVQLLTVVHNNDYLLMSSDGKYEIWELNSIGPLFSVPKPWEPQKWLFRSVLQNL